MQFRKFTPKRNYNEKQKQEKYIKKTRVMMLFRKFTPKRNDYEKYVHT